MERPLPDDVARPARAYLAALVPADEVSDAWHELLADVAYWDDRQLLPVLRLAHQVVLQHERVTPEVAALVLVETGIERPEDVATVLDADVEQARAWTRAALDTSAAQADEPPRDEPPRPEPTRPESSRTEPPRDHPPHDRAPREEPLRSDPEAAVPAPVPPSEALRIGFDEDEGPLPDLEGRGSGRLPTRTIVLTAIALWALVAVLWALAR